MFAMVAPDSSRLLLRLEGAAVLAVAAGIYAVYGASWWWFVGLFLVPDAFMIGYLATPRVGAVVYNVGHTYVTPLVLGGVAFALKASLLGSVALIWTAHIGFARLIGYGLKAPTDFHTTHLDSSS
jgi:hypothetical protein